MPRVRRCRYQGCHSFAMMPNHYCAKHISHESEYRQKRMKFAKRHSNPQAQWRYNHITRNRNPIKAEQNQFYHTKQWKDMREIVLNHDYHLCQYCKALGIVKEGNVIDHVLPVERFPDHMKDLKNLVTCCRDCHYWKTRLEEKYYGTGLHGKPTENPAITDIELVAQLTQKLKDANAREHS